MQKKNNILSSKKNPNTPYLPLLFAGREQVAATAVIKVGSTCCGQDMVEEVIIKSFFLAA